MPSTRPGRRLRESRTALSALRRDEPAYTGAGARVGCAEERRLSDRRRRLGLGFACALLALAVGELALRAFAPDISLLTRLFEKTNDARPYVLRPNARVAYAGFGASLGRTVVWQVNEQGLREDRRIGPHDGRFRIAVYGDSQAFGWSVPLEETFQRRMQALDPRVEVLNLAVPGYNVADTREHMARTLAAFAPDRVIFLASNNDFDRSLEVDTFWRHARLLMWGRFLYQSQLQKEARKALRRSPERLRFFADQIDRMIHLCESRSVPLVIGFLRLKNHRALLDHQRPDAWLATHPGARGANGFRVDLVDLEPRIADIPEADKHLSAPAYQVLAHEFCRVISDLEAGCVPNRWIAQQRGAETDETAGRRS